MRLMLMIPVMALAACAPSTNRATTRSGPSPSAVSLSQEVRDSIGASRLRLVEARLNNTPGGVLKAEVEVSNETKDYQTIVYRFEWFDGDGSRVESVQSQQISTTVDPGAVAVLRSIAPSEAAKDFRLQVFRR